MKAFIRLSLLFSFILVSLLFLVLRLNNLTAAASPRIRYVARSAFDNGDCSVLTNPCRIIQSAIDQTNDGDEMRVAQGIYNATVIAMNSKTTLTDATQVTITNLMNEIYLPLVVKEGIPLGNVLTLHLDEPQGSTTFSDSSGYGNNATCSGDTCPEAGIPGVVGSALRFDGVDDYIQIPHNGEFDQIEDQDKVTIAAWIQVNEWYYGYLFLISDQYEPIGFGWEFYLTPNSINFDPWYGNVNSCSFDFNIDEWYHVAMSYDRSLRTIQFYVNGSWICYQRFSIDIQDTNGEPMYIGYSPTGNVEYSIGLIDEAYIFNRALSEGEILAIYLGR